MLVLKDLLLEEVNYLTGIQPQVASVRREHALRVTALGNVLKVPFLKSDKRLLFKF
jgi:hypothetical protein